ncbi:TetR family transcriptional regulator [Corynebacterium breve]|uniref:TetR family transcriptional regulator n=1 Tax=Corynebacterium breve TaxID=3049799 RepID=A0ABY8VF08_9CORY|nr:TetR family transcriptional regulator [Corynebacterium breve]WIM67697.1 TetR family transcriptional regulator [Corynebacterium breve]
MKLLSSEQLLLLADEFCAVHHVSVRSFAALAAAAAIPGARFDGVFVFDSSEQASAALADGIRRLEPLTSHNREFGAVVAQVYARWAGYPR